MAVDEAILEHIHRGESLPTLRLYAWQPPCLSLGYAQPVADVDLPRLRERGWDLVRRPTGGRAILHTDELTYSVAAPADDPRTAGTVLESYNRIARALLRALQELGLPVEIEAQAPVPAMQGQANPVCFEVPSSYEITAGGRKLVGSAQARKREGVLQHGSLPLTGDLEPYHAGARLPRRGRPPRSRGAPAQACRDGGIGSRPYGNLGRPLRRPSCMPSAQSLA